MKELTTEEKVNYLEEKFNAPLDVIIKVINYCSAHNISVKDIQLKEYK